MNTYELSYEDFKDMLRTRVMDLKSNSEKLEGMVYEPVGCGLVLVPYTQIPEDIGEIGIAYISNEITTMDGWNREDIINDALKNSERKDRPKLCSMKELVFGATGKRPANLLKGGEVPKDGFLVLTTYGGVLGATALYYPGIKAQIGELIGGDYYILPSSVHEVLVLKDDENLPKDPKELAEMVKTINETQVEPKDRLCNRVFKYSVDTQRMFVAADPDRKKEMER